MLAEVRSGLTFFFFLNEEMKLAYRRWDHCRAWYSCFTFFWCSPFNLCHQPGIKQKNCEEFHVIIVYNVWGCHNRYLNKYLLLEGIIERTLVVEIMVVNNTQLTLEKSGVKGEENKPSPQSKISMYLVAQSCPPLCNPTDCRLLCQWGFSRPE